MKNCIMIVLAILVSVSLITTVFAQSTTDKAAKAVTDAAQDKAKEAVSSQAKTDKPAVKEEAKACQQITKICKNAGFGPGEAAKGTGLQAHCLNPIMQGKTKVPGAKKPLPEVDPKLVTACKAENPKFGQGAVGTK